MRDILTKLFLCSKFLRVLIYVLKVYNINKRLSATCLMKFTNDIGTLILLGGGYNVM